MQNFYHIGQTKHRSKSSSIFDPASLIVLQSTLVIMESCVTELVSYSFQEFFVVSYNELYFKDYNWCKVPNAFVLNQYLI